ncbi:MAG: ABC transporter permease subunit [Beutenbergiaceae bacterium]
MIVLVIVFDNESDGAFLTARNITTLLRQTATIAILAAGVALLILMAEIDLSIGSALYLCSVAAAVAHSDFGAGTIVTIAAAITTGLLLGLWQALLVVVLKIPSFIATLGGLLAFRSIGLVLTDSSPIGMGRTFSALSESRLPGVISYAAVAVLAVAVILGVARSTRKQRAQHSNSVNIVRSIVLLTLLGLGVVVALWLITEQGLPAAAVWVFGVGALMWFLTTRTIFGRNAYVIGANREAAYLSGIPVKKHMVIAFTVMGVLYGVAAVVEAARLGAVSPQTGNLMELDAIAAAVIGGVALRGGVGTVVGAMLGALLLSTIDNGLIFISGLDANWQPAIKAVILLVALAADLAMQRRAGKT